MKRTIDDLGIRSGQPAFSRALHVGYPNVGNRQRLLERINDILDRRWFTNNGVYVQEFERKIAQVIGVKHCIAVCNGTTALEIAIRAAGLTGEVIIPSFSFIATAHALQWQHLTPVFCDIDPQTYNLDPHQVNRMITRRTTGIIGVHTWGRPCAIDALSDIAARHKLTLLFDAAHAFGCSHRGDPIGCFGEAEIFSFHATKFINASEGGAVVTNNDELASKVRLMRNFGFSGHDTVIHIGINGKMSEFSAAMGLTSLESQEEFSAANLRNYRWYQQELQGIPSVRLMPYDEKERNNFHHIVLEIDDEIAGISRDRLLKIFHAENVLARRYFFPGSHRMEPYRSMAADEVRSLPNTERLAARVITLPTGHAVGRNEIRVICNILKGVVERGHKGACSSARSLPARDNQTTVGHLLR